MHIVVKQLPETQPTNSNSAETVTQTNPFYFALKNIEDAQIQPHLCLGGLAA